MYSTENGSRSERHSLFSSLITEAPRKMKKSSDPINHQAISEYFGELAFGLGQMREKLPKDAYSNLLKTLDHGKKLTKDTAEAIAIVVKEWAVSKGVTHYCHWFQPMTGLTAEKHDSFISIQHVNHSELRVMERFTGGQLIQGEPDASSFPSGGMRSTFEARGYTAWDPSSPIFIIEGELGKTLCIPSVFFGYHGEALDNKTPLLRSTQVLSREACEFLKLIGDVDVKSVNGTLGAEQEYFLIDKKFVALRPDILLTGRTLLGASSPRHQQLEDHYFGSIPVRAKTFMEDVEHELYKLGIPVKTRHNEVAPSQFELAPIFESINIATDHNTLCMEVMKRVANRHGMVCLLHEKPFAGINGSGKHCNWSIANDKGENLLDPGTTPHQNLRFLAVLAVVLKGVHEHADVLRASIASPGNDHRLGGNEAPPAIISVFLGSMLDKIFTDIEKGVAGEGTEQQIINLGVSHIPDISRDYTDRNRTSPFAFTGNKFEFRAVGASANTSVPVTFVNAAIADAFHTSAERLKVLLAKKQTRDEAVMELVRELVKESKHVRFEGNNYSQEWQAEAKKRGLPILPTTPDALKVLGNAKAVEFLSSLKILTKPEIESRHHIAVERYNKTLQIELATLIELVETLVVPAMEKQISSCSGALAALTLDAAKKAQKERNGAIEKVYADILVSLQALKETFANLHNVGGETEVMDEILARGIPFAKKLRDACDHAETLVSDALWPLPKYREMLFANTIA